MVVQRACPECMGLMVLDLAHDWFECKRCGTLIKCEVPIAEKYNIITQMSRVRELAKTPHELYIDEIARLVVAKTICPSCRRAYQYCRCEPDLEKWR